MSRNSKTGFFYLGKTYDIEKGKILDQELRYDPEDLTTHGIVVGMTGSGKTGLSIDLLEEAAIAGVPALLIDPKGDLTNLLLHFPEMRPEDFQPWIDPDEARNAEISVEQMAQNIAERWKGGLADWGIEPKRIKQVQQAVQYEVFTPGSDAGTPVSILSSLETPTIPWEDNREVLRDRISSTVTGLLGLIGVVADPVQSKEHILLSNVFEQNWSQGKSLDLVELIRQVQSPPFDKLGAFEVDQFFPPDERQSLAMSMNSLLASPGFQSWLQGHPLEIESLLWTPEGKPRHSVFYLAHLSAEERMFFVTLLLTSLESWMRSQSGSSALRALLYFDEVLGYMPPVKNPPSKSPLLRLLKQARAFGVGLLLVTQNPVDLDYKGLGNAGTWFIGRLQAEQDKSRLLDGLEGAAVDVHGLDRGKLDELISALDKRVFLLHNVHEDQPVVFHTRWAMAYLRGPITRVKLKELNDLVGAGTGVPDREPQQQPSTPEATTVLGSDTLSSARASAPAGIEEYILPNNLTLSEAIQKAGLQTAQVVGHGLFYRPTLLAQAAIRYLDRKHKIDHVEVLAVQVMQVDRRGFVRWEDHQWASVSADDVRSEPVPEAKYQDLSAPLNDAASLKQLRQDFLDFAYRSAELRLPSNPTLGLVAEPGMSPEKFLEQCKVEAEKRRNEEIQKLRETYKIKLERVKSKLSREERELAEDQSELSSRRMEEMATHVENVLGFLGGSRRKGRVSSSLTKRRMASKAKADVEESLDAIEEFKSQVQALEDEMEIELERLDDHWTDVVESTEELIITPFKKNILEDFFGLAWMPFWSLETGGMMKEIPATALDS